MLLNLIGNALKYRSADPPSVHVSAERKDGEWQFAVRDKGIGIESRHTEQIFEIFKRLQGQRDYPGSGIGLAVCRRVVHRHRGRIWVESEVVAVVGIRVQILQIVGNVIMNAHEAIQRAKKNSGCIEILATRKNIDDVEMVQLSIRDDGVGIEQDSLTRIFQRGFTSKSGTGSGLGLHWCANAVGAFGGSIRVESAGPGEGATVHIFLPIAPPHAANADGVEERAPGRKRA